MNDAGFRSGFVAVVGRPNVGKSTLVNRLVSEKVSIVTPKAQTTRHRVLGVLTDEISQTILVDTPGIHRRQYRALNRSMNRTAESSAAEADLAIQVVEAGRWTSEDTLVLDRLKRAGTPVGLLINKVDRIRDKASLLPFISDVRSKSEFEFIIPISARTGDNLESLMQEIRQRLPLSPALFPEDQFTDQTERQLVAEAIREKLTWLLRDEIPYSIAVVVEQFKTEGNLVRIQATIWVEKAGQKKIVIGEKGAMLKKVGSQARMELEKRLSKKVFLELWVKIQGDWADDERRLNSLGYYSE